MAAKELSEKELQEKAERKEVAKRRTFWFLLVFAFALLIYLGIQIVFLILN